MTDHVTIAIETDVAEMQDKIASLDEMRKMLRIDESGVARERILILDSCFLRLDRMTRDYYSSSLTSSTRHLLKKVFYTERENLLRMMGDIFHECRMEEVAVERRVRAITF